jgi:hypothetical protein
MQEQRCNSRRGEIPTNNPYENSGSDEAAGKFLPGRFFLLRLIWQFCRPRRTTSPLKIETFHTPSFGMPVA